MLHLTCMQPQLCMDMIDPCIGPKIHIIITLNHGKQPEGGVCLKLNSSRPLPEGHFVAVLVLDYS